MLNFAATGQPLSDAQRFLEYHGAFEVVAHQQRVAYAVVRLALDNGLDRRPAETAVWLHELSAVVPERECVATCRALEVALLPEEESEPRFTRGKLSRALAERLLGLRDEKVLDALQYHATLRAGASILEKVVFVADKQEGHGPEDRRSAGLVKTALEDSLEAGCLAYLETEVAAAETAGRTPHPDLAAAHAELSAHVTAARLRPKPAAVVRVTRRAAPRERRAAPIQPKFVIKGRLTQRPE